MITRPFSKIVISFIVIQFLSAKTCAQIDGDVNKDGEVNMSDVTYVINQILQSPITLDKNLSITTAPPVKSIGTGLAEPTATTAYLTSYFNDHDSGLYGYGIAISKDRNENLMKWQRIYSRNSHYGFFSVKAIHLTPNTKYYYRTFLTTDSTIFFYYAGNFTTLPLKPYFCINSIKPKWTDAIINFSHDCVNDADISGIAFREYNEGSEQSWKYANSQMFYDNKYFSILNNLIPDYQYEICPYIISGNDTIYGDISTVQTKGFDVEGDIVDLGLSVKWSSHNLGTSFPEDKGLYYAWGEINGHKESDKNCCSWIYYSLGDGTENTMNKYCLNSDYGKVDSLVTLLPEDDAATVALGSDWRIPTDDEFTELRTKCTWTWTSLHGVNGYVVFNNDSAIFLPVTGNKNGNVTALKYGGFYWSSSLLTNKNSCCAWRIQFYDTRVIHWQDYRYYGECIRPVHP